MKRKGVDSSNIASVGYKVKEETLEIRFNSGAVYQYKNVPRSVHEQLMSASSKGQFFHRNIRNSFDYSRVK